MARNFLKELPELAQTNHDNDAYIEKIKRSAKPIYTKEFAHFVEQYMRDNIESISIRATYQSPALIVGDIFQAAQAKDVDCLTDVSVEVLDNAGPFLEAIEMQYQIIAISLFAELFNGSIVDVVSDMPEAFAKYLDLVRCSLPDWNSVEYESAAMVCKGYLESTTDLFYRKGILLNPESKGLLFKTLEMINGLGIQLNVNHGHTFWKDDHAWFGHYQEGHKSIGEVAIASRSQCGLYWTYDPRFARRMPPGSLRTLRTQVHEYRGHKRFGQVPNQTSAKLLKWLSGSKEQGRFVWDTYQGNKGVWIIPAKPIKPRAKGFMPSR